MYVRWVYNMLLCTEGLFMRIFWKTFRKLVAFRTLRLKLQETLVATRCIGFLQQTKKMLLSMIPFVLSLLPIQATTNPAHAPTVSCVLVVCGILRENISNTSYLSPPATWIYVSYVVCCEVEISATCWSLVQGSSTECGVPECDYEASIMRRPWPIKGCRASGGKN
jgi:hypothetical protein